MRALHQLFVVQNVMHVFEVLLHGHQIVGRNFAPLLLPQVLYDPPEVLGFRLAQMPQVDEAVHEQLEVVEGDDAVFVHVDDPVEGADFPPPEVGFALSQNGT